MEQVVIYTTDYCPYCHSAKRLLRRKNLSFKEIDVTGDSAAREKLRAMSGRTTVPQIWIGATHVGGCDDLYALEAASGVEALLST